MTDFLTTIMWFLPVMVLVSFIYFYLSNNIIPYNNSIYYILIILLLAFLTNILIFVIIDLGKITILISIILNIIIILSGLFIYYKDIYKIPKNELSLENIKKYLF
jgi:hypothetical protein